MKRRTALLETKAETRYSLEACSRKKSAASWENLRQAERQHQCRMRGRLPAHFESPKLRKAVNNHTGLLRFMGTTSTRQTA